MFERETDFPLPVIDGDPHNPAPFQWEDWYGAVGGRSIHIDEVDAIKDRITNDQVPRFTGGVAEQQRRFTSADEAARWVKERARHHGADMVGIARVEPSDIYAGRQVNEPMAIVVGQAMRYESFVNVPSDASAIECMRVYESLGEVVIALAEELRAAGWHATVEHPVGDSSVLHIPLALKAGFGELGRHGSIIHPQFGPLFRIGSVLTTLPMQTDEAVDVGIGAFCDRCQACRIFCPADAIPDDRSANAGADPQGNDRYLVDTGKCFPYFAKQKYCSACLAVCAYKHKEWARMQDGTVGPFPDVEFGDVPAAQDPSTTDVHSYPRIRRADPSPFHRS
jgi:ferredoxin